MDPSISPADISAGSSHRRLDRRAADGRSVDAGTHRHLAVHPGILGSHRYILTYGREVLNRQPEDVQHFLMFTSILERFCASLCSEMVSENVPWARNTGVPGPGQSVSFALDDERKWTRYHHLFADLLKARLRQARPQLVPQLHLRASQWFENNGLVPEAVLHAFSAHDEERAAMLIERYGTTQLSVGDPTLLMLAGRLSSETLGRGKAGHYQAWMQLAEAFAMMCC
jgi:LuxR family maltose regulon positive regulatory protein